MKEEKRHESYGMIGIYRTHGRNQALFGSSILHDRYITLRIHHASVERRYHQEWYHADIVPVIEIRMSSSQFAEFVTTSNTGFGVPCTISYENGKEVESPPHEGHNEAFNRELREDFFKVMEDSDSLANDAREILTTKGPIKAADKNKLLEKIDMLTQHIKSNMPFLHKQFCRSMNKTVTAAKAEVESFYTSTVMKMGKKALDELNFKQPVIEIELHDEENE